MLGFVGLLVPRLLKASALASRIFPYAKAQTSTECFKQASLTLQVSPQDFACCCATNATPIISWGAVPALHHSVVTGHVQSLGLSPLRTV